MVARQQQAKMNIIYGQNNGWSVVFVLVLYWPSWLCIRDFAMRIANQDLAQRKYDVFNKESQLFIFLTSSSITGTL